MRVFKRAFASGTTRKKCVSSVGSSNIFSKTFCASKEKLLAEIKNIFLEAVKLLFEDIERRSNASSILKLSTTIWQKSGLPEVLISKLSQKLKISGIISSLDPSIKYA